MRATKCITVTKTKVLRLIFCLFLFFPCTYCLSATLFVHFLAHLSRRLIGELIVYPWSGVRRTSSVVRRPQCSNIFFSETAWPIKAKFYVEPPWVGGTKLFAASGSHDQDGRHAHIWQKPFKNLLLQNRRADFRETWYVASGTPAHHKLCK